MEELPFHAIKGATQIFRSLQAQDKLGLGRIGKYTYILAISSRKEVFIDKNTRAGKATVSHGNSYRIQSLFFYDQEGIGFSFQIFIT
jgi:hypothetical protein